MDTTTPLHGKEKAGSRAEFAHFNAPEGDQSFAMLKLLFWNIDFKLLIRKQKTQKEPLTLPLSQEILTEKPASGRQC